MIFEKKADYLIILFYNYTYIEDAPTFCQLHSEYCKKLCLLGRVIISHEGINGTLSGLANNIHTYIKNLQQDSRFYETDFKIEKSYKHLFPKLSVKYKKEIVSLKLEQDVFPNSRRMNYLTPKEFYVLSQHKEVLILDVRNNYEYQLGHFQNAINPNIRNFRDLPKWTDENISLLRERKVLIYCTGGVRCEKFSVFLQNKGIHEVYQLKGGIINYGQDPEIQGKLFEGQMYVFDERISVKVNRYEHNIVGKDFFDQSPCERYVNCANPDCNEQILCSERNEYKYLGSCCKECREHPQNRFVSKQNMYIETKF
ncbi:rhodanese-related sulfurtransferase [Candidatus Phytoplasma melaleucae]|uniref:tRNA uridine(34) hydroxylase n=1 Tax=Candidatus Phytoplasma melaleucae TaxID=2982630 RepID=A0ABT9DFD7_9MOLU|nr:rhodanese-related sulfurtransferase ['Melaleuca sp.' phytoplasma]MDO8168144.1 rhodanese-related sulfurtransferase ['Melaleuca sp.' phytoplasma]MDV3205228.1 rhodanese-related sulfurtransferase [Weeping tea tree witches'-broom phytoplasma]